MPSNIKYYGYFIQSHALGDIDPDEYPQEEGFKSLEKAVVHMRDKITHPDDSIVLFAMQENNVMYMGGEIGLGLSFGEDYLDSV